MCARAVVHLHGWMLAGLQVTFTTQAKTLNSPLVTICGAVVRSRGKRQATKSRSDVVWIGVVSELLPETPEPEHSVWLAVKNGAHSECKSNPNTSLILSAALTRRSASRSWSWSWSWTSWTSSWGSWTFSSPSSTSRQPSPSAPGCASAACLPGRRPWPRYPS